MSGTISTNTTWTVASSPYVVDGNLTVASGATLTIEPGVVVKLNGATRTMTVDGTLVAAGTAAARIVFTSLQDDSAGGDTGLDGPTVGARGQWYQLTLASAGDGTRLEHVDVRYGGYTSGEVRVAGGCGTVLIADSTITESGDDGLRVGHTNGCVQTASLERTVVADNHDRGIDVFNARLNLIDNSVVRDNGGIGIYFGLGSGYSSPSSLILHSDVRGNASHGIYFQLAESLPTSVFPRGYGNNVFENGGDELGEGSAVQQRDIDWTYNYFGESVGFAHNKSVCTNGPGKLAYTSDNGDRPAGPLASRWTFVALDPNTIVYCNYDELTIEPWEFSRHYIADGDMPIGWTWGTRDAPNTTGVQSDPVNSATGSFTHAVTDVSLPGAGIPFVLTRFYSSQDGRVGTLGAGWTHSLAARLVVATGGDVTLHGEDGQLVDYPQNPDGSFASPPGASSSLSRLADGTYVLLRHDQTVLRFSSAGALVSVRDRNDQGLTLAYDGSGRLSTVTDSAGRAIGFTYDASGRLTRVALPDGRDVEYGYTDGRLSTVTDLRGKVWTYAYDGYGWLEKEIDPLNHTVFRNVYSRWGRVVEQYDALNNKTTFAWDEANQTQTATDARGKQWKDVYDGYKLVKRIDPLGNETSYGYDADFNVTSVTDPPGKTATMSYDSSGNLVTRTAPAPLSYQESWAYNGRNDITGYTNGRGKTTSYGYDGAGNLSSITEPGSVTTSFGRNATAGLVTSITDPRAKTTSFGYDAAHNLTSVTTPLGFVTTMTYDGSGRLLNVVDPRGNQPGANPGDYMTEYTYNGADQPLTVRDPLGHTTTFAYDDAGNRTSVTDANAHATSWGYDAANRLISVTAPGGAVTAYEYDGVGNLTKRTAPGSRITTYGYDDAGRLTSTTSPTGRVWGYGYDAAGDVVSVATPAGGTIGYGYDALGRLISIDYSDATPDVTYGYDGNGNRIQMSDGAGSETYAYDDLDRLTAITRGTDSFGYGYDNAGNLTSRTYPGGRQTGYTFDDDGRLATVTSNGQGFTLGYDAAGVVTSVAYPNGANESRTYDRAGRVSQVVHERSGTTIASAAYTYDPVGNPTQISRDSGVESYSYDARDRLSEVCYGAACADFVRYAYDAVGNRSSETRPAGTTTYGYNLADELLSTTGPGGTTSYAFDANGNQTQAGGRTFTYDLANRLASTTAAGVTTSYAYDGDGKRLSATAGGVTTSFLWDPNAALPQLALERDAAGSILRSYLLGEEPLAFEEGGASRYLHADALGSIVATTDAAGATEWTSGYEPYGQGRNEQLLNPGASASPLRFTGAYLDPTGLYHLRARHYDPATGRFGALDPLAPAVEGPYLASYHYAANRPTVLIDPSGMGAVPSDERLGARERIARGGVGVVTVVGGVATGVGGVAFVVGCPLATEFLGTIHCIITGGQIASLGGAAIAVGGKFIEDAWTGKD